MLTLNRLPTQSWWLEFDVMIFLFQARGWHQSCYTYCMTRNSKFAAKSSGLAKSGPKKPSGIRLDDLMPKKRVTGGKGLLFGASDNSQPTTNQPEETT